MFSRENLLTVSPFPFRAITRYAATWSALALLAVGPVSFLIIDRAGGVVWTLSMLAGLVIACVGYHRWWPELRESRLLAVSLGLLLVYLAMPVLSYLIVDGSEFAGSRVKRQFLLLAAPFVFLLLWWLRPRLLTVLVLIATNASVFGLYAMWFVYNQHSRASGVTHAVHFGNVSLILGFASLALIAETNRYRWWILAVTGMALGIVGSALSGTRGDWVATPFLVGVALIMGIRVFKLKWYMIAGLVSLTIAGLIGVSQISIVQGRFAYTLKSFDQLLQNQRSSSMGTRLVMWEQAWQEIREAPLLGAGYSGYRNRVHVAVKSGTLPKSMLLYATEPHNEYLYQWATRGALGLVVFLFCLLGSSWYFTGWLWRGDTSRIAVAHVGLSLVIVVAVGGLTITVVDERAVIRFLGWSLAVLIYCVWLCGKQEQKAIQEHQRRTENWASAD